MYHRLVFSVALALISLAVLAGTAGIYSSGAPPTVPAASRASSTLTVTSTGDSGPGSLRQAIADASPGDTIVFAVTGTIVLTTGELSVNKDLIIEGPGVDNLAINGNSASRVFSIQGAVVSISDITVGTGASTDGGGIYNTGVLSLTNTTVSSNSASRNGGGIYNDGSLTLINSTVSGNTAMVGGGAVYNTLGSPVNVTGSTLSDNSGRPGGGIFNAGGRVDVINSTISGNRSVGGNGGGIHNSSGEVELTNVTVTGNSAPGNGGGGVYDGDQVAYRGA